MNLLERLKGKNRLIQFLRSMRAKLGSFKCDLNISSEFGCWICPVFEYIFDAISVGAFKVYESLRKPAVLLLGVGFALWLAFQFLFLFGGGVETSPQEFWDPIVKRAFAVLFVASVLNFASPKWIFDNTIMPMSDITTEYSSLILKPIQNISTAFKIKEEDETKTKAVSENQVFDPDLKKQVLESIERITFILYRQLEIGKIIGKGAVQKGLSGTIIPALDMFATSIILIGLYAIVLIYFAFFIVEAIFRVGVVAMLMPLLIVSWAFPSTRRFAINGMEMFLQAFVLLLLINIIIGLGVVMTDMVLGGSMIDMSQSPEDLMKKFSFTSVTFHQILFVSILTALMFIKASDLSTQFSSLRSAEDLADVFKSDQNAGISVITFSRRFINTKILRKGAQKIAAPEIAEQESFVHEEP